MKGLYAVLPSKPTSVLLEPDSGWMRELLPGRVDIRSPPELLRLWTSFSSICCRQ